MNELKNKLLKRYSSIRYFILSLERSKEGQLHIHLFIIFSNGGIRGTSLKKHIFDNANIHFEEEIRGTNQEIVDYLCKSEPKHSDKRYEFIPGGQLEYGELPQSNQGSRTDLAKAYAMINEGKGKKEIYDFNPNLAKYHTALDDFIKVKEDSEYGKKEIERKVIYVQGRAGLGKTEKIYKDYGIGNVHAVDNYQFPGDGYTHQNVTVFDDFYSNLEYAQLLKLLQGKPFKMNVKGSYVYNTSDIIYFTSNTNIEEQYPNIKEKDIDRWVAFIRRIDTLRVYTGYLKYTDYKIVKVDMGVDANGYEIQQYDFVNDTLEHSYFGHLWCYENETQGKYEVIKYY